MASGKKNYFRHSFSAGNDDKIVSLITDHGKQAYFHYFRLLELCGEQAAESIPDKFIFHRRTLCAELMVTNSKLGHHLLAMQSSLLLEHTLSDSKVEILIPNLAKYLGKYTTKKHPNSSNKRKEKKRKENTKTDCKFDIELIYNAYPKKQGKAAGIKKLLSNIKEQKDFDKILAASERYAEFCKRTGVEKKYIKQFSTWVNQECWEDEIDVPITEQELAKRFEEL